MVVETVESGRPAGQVNFQAPRRVRVEVMTPYRQRREERLKSGETIWGAVRRPLRPGGKSVIISGEAPTLMPHDRMYGILDQALNADDVERFCQFEDVCGRAELVAMVRTSAEDPANLWIIRFGWGERPTRAAAIVQFAKHGVGKYQSMLPSLTMLHAYDKRSGVDSSLAFVGGTPAAYSLAIQLDPHSGDLTLIRPCPSDGSRNGPHWDPIEVIMPFAHTKRTPMQYLAALATRVKDDVLASAEKLFQVQPIHADSAVAVDDLWTLGYRDQALINGERWTDSVEIGSEKDGVLDEDWIL